MSPGSAPIMLPSLCETHRALLVGQTGYSPNDPWLALEVITQVALFQGASADPKVHAECGADIATIAALGCMACRKPDLFGEIIDTAQRAPGSKVDKLGAVKALGEKWVASATADLKGGAA